MNKQELINAIEARTGKSKAIIRDVLEGLEAVSVEALQAGDEVALPGFGKLKPDMRASRTARNPKTGEPIQVAAKTVVKFSAAKSLSAALN